VPVIDVLDALPPAAGFETAHVDDAATARLAFDHLAGLGLRSFAYIGPSGRRWASKRREGFVVAGRGAGFAVAVREFPRSIHTHEPASDCAQKLGHWLQRHPSRGRSPSPGSASPPRPGPPDAEKRKSLPRF
jgi:DNA-binding LacI/PurR family transcriptional regulator